MSVFTCPSHKATMYRYNIPGADYDCGGTVIIDNYGMFSAITDYGNYSYWWHWNDDDRKREDFRAFVAKLCKNCADGYLDYLLEKLVRHRTELDVKATQKYLKVLTFQHYKAHLRCRRKKCTSCEGPSRSIRRYGYGCETEEFDNEWMRKTLKWIANVNDRGSLDEFYHCSRLLIDGEDFPSNNWDSHAVHFATKLMPRLFPIIEKELIEDGIWRVKEAV